MLFRPRKPFKILGITLFPQGMIPRHRDRLANAIGKAVGEELVSQETIMEELLGKDFLRKKIRGVVDSYTDEIVSQDYPSLIEALPANSRTRSRCHYLAAAKGRKAHRRRAQKRRVAGNYQRLCRTPR